LDFFGPANSDGVRLQSRACGRGV